MKPGDARYARRYNMVTEARQLVRTLSSRGYPSLRIRRDVLNDEDHLSVAPRGFTRGLKHLLASQPEWPLARSAGGPSLSAPMALQLHQRDSPTAGCRRW